MQILQSTITIKNIRLYAHHGVMEQERKVGGDFTVDLVLHLNCATDAILHDDLSATVNYAEAYAVVHEEMSHPSALLEHVAGRIASHLLERFPLVESLEVSVTKVNPPMGADCDGASFTLRAGR